MARNFNNGVWVYCVNKFGTAGVGDAVTDVLINYCFKCRIDSKYFDNLGLTPISSGTINEDFASKSVIAPNNWQPPRAQKITAANGYESSFCSDAQIETLVANGWDITRGKTKIVSGGVYSDPVYVDVFGHVLSYGWLLNNKLIPDGSTILAGTEGGSPTAITTETFKSDLGIKSVGDKIDILYGATFPRPPRAALKCTNGDKPSTFVDKSKVGNAGLLAKGYAFNYSKAAYSAAHLKQIMGLGI